MCIENGQYSAMLQNLQSSRKRIYLCFRRGKKNLSHISGSLPDNQKIFPVFPTEKIDLFYILNIIRCLLIYEIVQPIGKHQVSR